MHAKRTETLEETSALEFLSSSKYLYEFKSEGLSS